MSATPGPWRVVRTRHASDPQMTTVGSEKYGAVACTHGSRPSDEENEANAHLIAAAPTMLAALQYADEYLAAVDSDIKRGVLSASRVALGAARDKILAALALAANGREVL